MTGQELIAAERARQLRKGFTLEADAKLPAFALRRAASAYLVEHHVRQTHPTTGVPDQWILPADRWKPSPGDRGRELVRAGALYLAEAELRLGEGNLAAYRALLQRAKGCAGRLDLLAKKHARESRK